MNLHGVALVDKPAGMSSFSVVSRLRRVFKSVGVTKAGHTGTLDPLATGLLPICMGESTKYAQRLLDSDKGYRAIIQFGVATTTGDAEGEITARTDAKVDADALSAALEKFRGPIVQIPPIYSALKIAGKPAYEYARAGQAVEIAPRSVTIHELNLLAFDEPAQTATIDVRCSKGTYIRTLAIDVAIALGNVGHLHRLQRTLTGGFSLAQARPLDAWMEADDATRISWLLPTDQLVADLPSLMLDARQSIEIRQGKVVYLTAPTNDADAALTAQPLVRLYEPSGAFLGLGSLDAARLLRAERLLNTAAH
ncbi:MAG: tRNA pseudouridine(55) synthase TruB [Casimicrobium sp.]